MEQQTDLVTKYIDRTMHPNQKAYNPVFTSYRHGTNTVCCPLVVRLMSACCPLLKRTTSGHQADNKRTTDGVDWVKKASGSEVFFYKLSKHQQANA
ncbi:MAG: hypothetical protein K5918_00965, partial [Bacteroidales bacterium]|nr:hypothetical protein [Bacteroidales bacterium]